MGNIKQTERRKYDEEFAIGLATLTEKVDGINIRLDKINGSIGDYQTTRERLANACEVLIDIKTDINENVKPKLTNLYLKIAGLVALFGSIGAGAGSLITYFVLKGIGG